MLRYLTFSLPQPVLLAILVANIALLLFAVYLFAIKKARFRWVDVLWLTPLVLTLIIYLLEPLQVGEEPWDTFGALSSACVLPGGPPCTNLGLLLLNISNVCPLLALLLSPFGIRAKRERRGSE